MPLTRASLLKGKPPEYRKAILDGLYQAMRETLGVPEADRFMLIEEYEKSNFAYGANYLGIARNDALVAELLGKSPGIRPETILINLLEVPKENWSCGNGIAQYA